MIRNKGLSRRQLLQSSAAIGVATCGRKAQVWAQDSPTQPSDRLQIGIIGVGGFGMVNLRSMLKFHDVQITAVCDVDETRRNRARTVVDSYYSETKRSSSSTWCAAHGDFREVLARTDVDAVVISTPDHWHALPAIAAAKAKKHIYCEKPISLTVSEGRAMSKAVEQHGVIFQAGTQLRSSDATRFACELVRNGYLGQLRTIHVGTPRGKTLPKPPEMPIPTGFDYDRWLGPAPIQPYTERRCHGTFRFIFDYSGGEITDHGAHYIDIAQWGHGSELSGPIEYEGKGNFPTDGLFDTATQYEVSCRYADGVRLIISSEKAHGTLFEGSEGKIHIDDGGIHLAEPQSLITVQLKPNDVRLYRSQDHHRNFVDSVQKLSQPIAPVEVAHRTATIAHIGNIAMKLGRNLSWNPITEEFAGDSEANAMLSRPMRAPWKLD